MKGIAAVLAASLMSLMFLPLLLGGSAVSTGAVAAQSCVLANPDPQRAVATILAVDGSYGWDTET
ncbi:MAG: hypothetical protein ABMA25_29190, partial [Ilumatobacteraceae bacterium]